MRTKVLPSGYRAHNHICGCYILGQLGRRSYLPQVRLESHATLNPVSFTTNLTQTFYNPNDEPIPQCRYTFPLFDGIAVNGYTISYGDKALHGIVKQKEVAKQTYQAAIDRGETAGLLESLPAGIFGVTLGNVPPKTDIVVHITYCGELKHDAGIDGLRYTLPTSIAPRYGTYPGEILQSNTINQGGMSITVVINIPPTSIHKIHSPSHPITITSDSVSLTNSTTELSTDFILHLQFLHPSNPLAVLETHPSLPSHRALLTTFLPSFPLPPRSKPKEIIFLADQSGSMSGSKTTNLIAALRKFLDSLGEEVRFNICAFGSSFEFLFPQSRFPGEENLAVAKEFVGGFAARLGGTEILQAMRATFDRRLKHQETELEILLLTDGEIWAESELFEFCKDGDARVFALGIGGDVSHTLVEGVARAGRGFAQFFREGEERELGGKVGRMLECAMGGRLEGWEVQVDFEDEEEEEEGWVMVEKEEQVDEKPVSSNHTAMDIDNPTNLPHINPPKILQAPTPLPPLYPFNRSTIYLLLSPDSPQKNILAITLRAGSHELNIPISSTQIGTSIHQLAARKAIQDLEENRGWLHFARRNDEGVPVKEHFPDNIVEKEIVRLGEKFQVASKFTPFVAVEDGTQKLVEDMVEMDLSSDAKHAKPGGFAPRKQLAYKAARRSAPSAVAPRHRRIRRVPKPAPLDPVASMHRLLTLQRSRGSWKWSEEVFRLLGLKAEDVDVRKFGGKEGVAATVLVVAFLEKKLSDEKRVWEAAVQKARTWIEGQVDVRVEKLVGCARGLFG